MTAACDLFFKNEATGFLGWRVLTHRAILVFGRASFVSEWSARYLGVENSSCVRRGSWGWGLVRRCGLECESASTWVDYGDDVGLAGRGLVSGWERSEQKC